MEELEKVSEEPGSNCLGMNYLFVVGNSSFSKLGLAFHFSRTTLVVNFLIWSCCNFAWSIIWQLAWFHWRKTGVHGMSASFLYWTRRSSSALELSNGLKTKCFCDEIKPQRFKTIPVNSNLLIPDLCVGCGDLTGTIPFILTKENTSICEVTIYFQCWFMKCDRHVKDSRYSYWSRCSKTIK
mgnify:CR=1 FL=1